MTFITFNTSIASIYDNSSKTDANVNYNRHFSSSEKIRNEMHRLHASLSELKPKHSKQLYKSAPITETPPNSAVSQSSINFNLVFNRTIENSKQNPNEGDCWLLTGVNTLRESKQGQKVINNAVKLVNPNNPNSNVIVRLKGVNRVYIIAQKDIQNNQYKLSSGDADVKAIELAVRMYREEIIASEKGKTELDETYVNFCGSCKADAPTDYGTPDELIFYLTGIKPEATNLDNSTCENVMKPEQILDKIKNDPDNYATWVGYKDTYKDKNGKEVEFAHACAIAKVTDDSVYVVDSWDSSKMIKKPKAEFIKSIYEITTTNLSSVQ